MKEKDDMKNRTGQDSWQSAGIITETEAEAAAGCIRTALNAGASQIRVSLDKSIIDSFALLNGELDKVAHAADRSVCLYIFANGRYGTFSTNVFEKELLQEFVKKAVRTTGLLAEDRFRRLPDSGRTAKDALKGDEAGLYDRSRHHMTPGQRLKSAMSGTIYSECRQDAMKTAKGAEYSIISEECEYSDSIDDNITMDSQGFLGRHIETSFGYTSEITVGTPDGGLFSGYWWDSSPFKSGLRIEGCSETALKRAIRQVGPERCSSGKYNMVVDSSVS